MYGTRIEFDDFGRLLGKVFVVALLSLVLTIVGTGALMYSMPGKPTFTATDPPTIALVISWVGTWVSMLCYNVWSVWQLRRMPVDSPAFTSRTLAGKPVFLLGLVFADTDDLTAYEERLQLTVQSLLLWIVLLVVPVYSAVTGPGGKAAL